MDFVIRTQIYLEVYHNELLRGTTLFREYAPGIDNETKQIIEQVQTEIRGK